MVGALAHVWEGIDGGGMVSVDMDLSSIVGAQSEHETKGTGYTRAREA